MEMKIKTLFLGLCVAACGSVADFRRQEVSEVYVKDFQSSEPMACKTTDVPLGHPEAAAFFQSAKRLDYKTMTDNYPEAPCYIEGTLKYKGATCDWKISAASTGSIKCGNQTEWHFACDSCKDLFRQQ